MESGETGGNVYTQVAAAGLSTKALTARMASIIIGKSSRSITVKRMKEVISTYVPRGQKGQYLNLVTAEVEKQRKIKNRRRDAVTFHDPLAVSDKNSHIDIYHRVKDLCGGIPAYDVAAGHYSNTYYSRHNAFKFVIIEGILVFIAAVSSVDSYYLTAFIQASKKVLALPFSEGENNIDDAFMNKIKQFIREEIGSPSGLEEFQIRFRR